LQFLIKKITIKFPAVIFSILGHQTLDPDPQLEKMLDPVRNPALWTACLAFSSAAPRSPPAFPM
jgi:hypothetical protein